MFALRYSTIIDAVNVALIAKRSVSALAVHRRTPPAGSAGRKDLEEDLKQRHKSGTAEVGSRLGLRPLRTKSRPRRPDWRRIKIHRSYTVDDVARVLGVAKGTVRRWIKNGLAALHEQKPALILGADLIAFGRIRKVEKQRCKAHECYCVKCRAPRAPFGNLVEYVPLTLSNGNLRGLCPDCGTLINKRIAGKKIPELGKILTVSITQGQSHLLDSPMSCLNDYFD